MPGRAFGRAVHDGHRLALVLLVLGGLERGGRSRFRVRRARVEPAAGARPRFAWISLWSLSLGLVGDFVRYGGPATLAQKGYTAFKAPPPHVEGEPEQTVSQLFRERSRGPLAARVGRRQGACRARRGLGHVRALFSRASAGGVGRVRDAHGLYIETLAELGPLGLACCSERSSFR